MRDVGVSRPCQNVLMKFYEGGWASDMGCFSRLISAACNFCACICRDARCWVYHVRRVHAHDDESTSGLSGSDVCDMRVLCPYVCAVVLVVVVVVVVAAVLDAVGGGGGASAVDVPWLRCYDYCTHDFCSYGSCGVVAYVWWLWCGCLCVCCSCCFCVCMYDVCATCSICSGITWLQWEGRGGLQRC